MKTEYRLQFGGNDNCWLNYHNRLLCRQLTSIAVEHLVAKLAHKAVVAIVVYKK